MRICGLDHDVSARQVRKQKFKPRGLLASLPGTGKNDRAA